jgi:Na+/proline symporter
VTTITWYYVPGLTDIMYEGVPGFILSLVAVVLVSLRTRPPEQTDRIMADLERAGAGRADGY